MARITVEDCLDQVGDDNRFALVHLTVERIRQLRHGESCLVKGKNKEIVMALREIASGEVRFDNLKSLPRKKVKVVVPEETVEEAETVE